MPPRSPTPKPGRSGKPGRGRPVKRAGKRAPTPEEVARAERLEHDRKAAERGRKAGWGSVARKGAGQVGRGGAPGAPKGASDAFREAAGGAWEPERWVDEGPAPGGDLRRTASGAVDRGRGAAATRRPRRASPAEYQEDQTATRRRAPAELEAEVVRSVGKAKATKLGERVAEAARAFQRGRFDDARRMLRPLAESAPQSAVIRELHGLSLYRLGRWRDAARELEAFRALTDSVEQHPVLADCYRALRRYEPVEELWAELREASPSAELVAEGRIVAAGALADRGDLRGAIALLEAAAKPARKPKEHHLRVAYALADLYERAGDVPRARELFRRVAAGSPDFADVRDRLANL